MPKIPAPPRLRIGMRSLLLILVAVASLPGLILVVQNYRQSRADAQERLKVELQTVAVLAQSGQENVVAGVRNILETVASGPSVRRTDIRQLCFEFLGNIVARSSNFANLGFADAQGDVQCIARGAGRSLSVADRNYFQLASSSQRFSIGGFVVGRVSAAPALGFGIPVYDYASNYVGVAFATVNLKQANSVLQNLLLHQGLRVDLADAEGVLLGSTSANFGRIGTSYPVEQVRRAIVQAARDGLGVATVEHEGHWVQVRAVGAGAGRNLYVLASANVDQSIAALGDRLVRQLLVLFALLGAGLLLAWQMGLSLVARPLLGLRRTMEAAATTSDLLPPAQRHLTKEIHALDVGLQDMVEKLRLGQLQIKRAQQIAAIGFYTIDLQAGVYRIDPTVRALLAMDGDQQEVPQAAFEAAFFKEDLQELRSRRALLSQSGGEFRVVLRFQSPHTQRRVLELFERLPGGSDADSAVLSGAIQDVTERHQLQRMYAFLGSANQAVILSRTPAELFSQLCSVAVEEGEFRLAWVAAVDAEKKTLTPLAVAGHDDGFIALAAERKIDLDGVESPAAMAFSTDDLVVIDDVGALPQSIWWRTSALRRGYHSVAAIPLKLDCATQAVAIFMAPSPYHFRSDERRLLVALAASLSNALSHQRVLMEREQVVAELTTTSERLIRAQSLARLGNWTRYAADGSAVWSPGLYEVLARDPALGPPPVQDARRNVHPEDLDTYLSTMASALTGDSSIRQIRYRCQREDGQWRWLEEMIDEPVRDPEGAVIHISGTVQDITDRMESERTLQLQLSRIELLNQIARATDAKHDMKSVFAVVCEKLESRFNAAATTVLRRGVDAGMFVVEHVGERGKSAARTAGLEEGVLINVKSHGLARCLTGELVYSPDMALFDETIPRTLVAAGLRGLVSVPLQSSGETFGLILIARVDIDAFSAGECEFLRQLGEQVSLAATHARLIESLQSAYRELEDAQQSAMQQERLRLLGQMASGIAHDINNAISPISLYADSLLHREPLLSEAGRTQLETIQLAVHNVTDTISRLRDFYRPDSEVAQSRPIQPNRLVVQALEITKARWRDQSQLIGVVIEVVTELIEPCPDLLLVEAEVRDAVVNLVLNAVDAMPTGGVLGVSTRRVVASGGDGLDIEVCDTGLGMSEETLSRCIEPFFTTKGDQGSGLGLAMVFGCMKRHGGDVLIDSRPGEGTCVRLRFKLGDTPATLNPDLLSRPAHATTPRRRVLLIDDDPLLLQASGAILRGAGHGVVTAANGEVGLLAFEEQLDTAPFDIVLTDLGMPGLDGRTVAMRVKAMSPATPVIMLTGWGRRMQEDGETPAHVDRLLSKPPQRRLLLDAVEELTASSA